MESSSTAEVFLHGVTDTCSFLDAPFFMQKCFWGWILLIFVSYIIYRLNIQAMGVYDEFCLVATKHKSGEHITYNPIVAVNFY